MCYRASPTKAEDEPFRTFTAQVRGKLETCSYTTLCTYDASVDYTDHIICDVILNGLYDTNIRREVLGIAGILEKPMNEVIALVETKEMARNALPPLTISCLFLREAKEITTKPRPNSLSSGLGKGSDMPWLSHRL